MLQIQNKILQLARVSLRNVPEKSHILPYLVIRKMTENISTKHETWVQVTIFKNREKRCCEISDCKDMAKHSPTINCEINANNELSQTYPSFLAKGNTKPPRQRSTWRHVPWLKASSPSSYKRRFPQIEVWTHVHTKLST